MAYELGYCCKRMQECIKAEAFYPRVESDYPLRFAVKLDMSFPPGREDTTINFCPFCGKPPIKRKGNG